jgi:hypothetical protein
MTAFDTLLPSHAQLIRAAVRPSPPRPGTRAKYVVINTGGNMAIAIPIPEHVNHCDAVNPQTCQPLSAGFYWLDQAGHVHTEGESVSLNLKPHPDDAEIIQDTLYLMGLL